MFCTTTVSDHSQTLPGSGAAPVDEGQLSKAFLRSFSQSCLTVVQDYQEGKRSKSDTIKRLAILVIGELERASRAGDNVKEVSSVLCAYLEILNGLEKGVRKEAIAAREVGKVEVAKAQVATTPKRGREDEEPHHPAIRTIDLDLIPFGRPVSAKLPDDLRRTHELQDNYARDLAHAEVVLLNDQSRPEFPSDLWKNVLTNTFIDFDPIFNQFQFFSPECRQISGSGDWVFAWNRYEKAVLFAFPHREVELLRYKNHIQELFLTLPDSPKTILRYDKRIRTRVAESDNLRLCDISEFISDCLLIEVED